MKHDKSIYSANDGKRKLCMEKGKQPLRPKNERKGIMVSDFITECGRLKIPTDVTDEEFQALNLPQRQVTEYLEYGKDNYWTCEKPISSIINVALPTFSAIFPNVIRVWVFDNSTSHPIFPPGALKVSDLNRGFRGKQPNMRPSINPRNGEIQHMHYPRDHPNIKMAVQHKGVIQILTERGLWGKNYKFECKKGKRFPGCDEPQTCCAKAILCSQPDFADQKGLIQDELEKHKHLVLFLLKFYCELNPMESYPCPVKWYCREHCDYTPEGLRNTIPKALAYVAKSTIRGHFGRCFGVLEPYKDHFVYGTPHFKRRVYQSHRRVEDKSLC